MYKGHAIFSNEEEQYQNTNRTGEEQELRVNIEIM